MKMKMRMRVRTGEYLSETAEGGMFDGTDGDVDWLLGDGRYLATGALMTLSVVDYNPQTPTGNG